MTDNEDNGLEKTLKDLEISPNPLPRVVVWDEFLPLELNPFQRRPRSRSTGSICTCLKRTHQLNENSKTSFKRSSKKLLKDPVLKYVTRHVLDEMLVNKTKKSLTISNTKTSDTASKKAESTNDESQPVNDLNTLLDGCERLSIGTETRTDSKNRTSVNNCNKSDSRGNGGSCSQEAIAGMGITPPCDVTMDELASYFETFVHIPKKMSSMAEMMYI